MKLDRWSRRDWAMVLAAEAIVLLGTLPYLSVSVLAPVTALLIAANGVLFFFLFKRLPVQAAPQHRGAMNRPIEIDISADAWAPVSLPRIEAIFAEIRDAMHADDDQRVSSAVHELEAVFSVSLFPNWAWYRAAMKRLEVATSSGVRQAFESAHAMWADYCDRPFLFPAALPADKMEAARVELRRHWPAE